MCDEEGKKNRVPPHSLIVGKDGVIAKIDLKRMKTNEWKRCRNESRIYSWQSMRNSSHNKHNK